MRLLLVEDERDLNRVIAKRLIRDGYTVDSAYDGVEALDYLAVVEYDAVILDIMMPKMNGFDVLLTLRDKGNNTPVLILTARDGIDDRVRGLDSGAQDYLIKPFAYDELAARIRAMTRKAAGAGTNVLSLDDLSLDIATRKVKRGNTEIALSAKEFDILEYLLQNKGIVLSREKIENHVWDLDYEGGSNVVDVYIRYLRKKIDEPFDSHLIQTIRGKGYVIREE